MTAEATPEIVLVQTDDALERVADRCRNQPEIAVDIEADGLFVFRPRLCCMQIAWTEDGRTHVAIVDTLAIRPTPLRTVLGADGPTKVLHDLTFDARMLEDTGLSLARVRDTSVAARFLGHTATGLATLLEGLLGVRLDKGLQQHNWGKRPLTDAQIQYLAGDVAHLIALSHRLDDEVRQQGIEDEVAEECAYKLETAIAPPRDSGPSYARIKGAVALDPVARAVLRELVEARTRAAEDADVPPFKIVDNAVLLDLARSRPTSRSAIAATRASVGRAARYMQEWLRAVERGVAQGDIPDEDRSYFERRRPAGPELSMRRQRESQLSAWRRDEAKRRAVCEQAVLPGHCAQELLGLLVEPALPDDAFRARMGAIPGIGRGRVERYGEAWLALRRARSAEESVPPPA